MMKKKHIKKRLYSVAETAEYLGLSERTIYNQTCRRAKKKFPVPWIKWGKLVKFDKADLDDHIDTLPRKNGENERKIHKKRIQTQ
jgi:excisionase family DNA binding protein